MAVVIYDLETTGLLEDNPSIIQIGAVLEKDENQNAVVNAETLLKNSASNMIFQFVLRKFLGHLGKESCASSQKECSDIFIASFCLANFLVVWDNKVF